MNDLISSFFFCQSLKRFSFPSISLWVAVGRARFNSQFQQAILDTDTTMCSFHRYKRNECEILCSLIQFYPQTFVSTKEVSRTLCARNKDINNLHPQPPRSFQCEFQLFGHCVHAFYRIELLSRISCSYVMTKCYSLLH